MNGSFLILLFGMSTFVSQKILYREEFDSSWKDRWQEGKSYENPGIIERSKGKLEIEDEMGYGLRTLGEKQFYEISHQFKEPIKIENATFVLQYTTKNEGDSECEDQKITIVKPGYNPVNFGINRSEILTFGPDCYYNKGSLQSSIFIDGEANYFKKIDEPFDDFYTHIYTMILHQNDTYAIYRDMKLVSDGNISDDWNMKNMVLIPDTDDIKPDEWDDRMYIDDPKSVKPSDWVDEKIIEDPNARKPKDWDDTNNGTWTIPLIENPAYKGEWKPKKIYNSDYQGPWVLDKKSIFVKKNNTSFPCEIGEVGFDLWQTYAKTMFDNIMIATSPEDAFEEAKKILEIQIHQERKIGEDLIREKKERERIDTILTTTDDI